MLVLSRQRDETIMIGDGVEITIVDIRGDKVRLGINAPRSVAVHRKEVYEAIRRENADATDVQTHDLSVADPQPETETPQGSLIVINHPASTPQPSNSHPGPRPRHPHAGRVTEDRVGTRTPARLAPPHAGPAFGQSRRIVDVTH